MGGPVSPIVANLCMEEIEELARSQSKSPPKKWYCFVRYIFAIIKKHMLTTFYSLLNSIDPHIKFIMKREQDDKLSFLDTYTRNSVNGSLLINVYRKPTDMDAYLDFNCMTPRQTTQSQRFTNSPIQGSNIAQWRTSGTQAHS